MVKPVIKRKVIHATRSSAMMAAAAELSQNPPDPRTGDESSDEEFEFEDEASISDDIDGLKIGDDEKEVENDHGLSLIEIQEIATFLEEHPSLLGSVEETKHAETLTSNTAKHEAAKLSAETRFFEVISRVALLKPLTLMVKDTVRMKEAKKRTPIYERQLYINLRGDTTLEKKKILNKCLLITARFMVLRKYVGQDHAKASIEERAKMMYQPSTLKTYYKLLFATFKDHGLYWSFSKDFKGKGELCGYYKYLFVETQAVRSDYGLKVKQGQFDEDSHPKIIAALKSGLLCPFNTNHDSCFNHLMMILVDRMFETFMLRADKEPRNLKMSQVKLGEQRNGEYQGREKLSLCDAFVVDKTHQLSITGHSYARDMTGYNDMIANPDDPTCIVLLVKFYIHECLPAWDGVTDHPFFVQQASKKKRQELLKNGVRTPSGKVPLGDIEKPMGKNSFNPKCKALAKLCGFVNAERCTASGKRRQGISKLANSNENINADEIRGAARHVTSDAHTGYQVANSASHAKRFRALAGVQAPTTPATPQNTQAMVFPMAAQPPQMQQTQAMVTPTVVAAQPPQMQSYSMHSPNFMQHASATAYFQPAQPAFVSPQATFMQQAQHMAIMPQQPSFMSVPAPFMSPQATFMPQQMISPPVQNVDPNHAMMSAMMQAASRMEAACDKMSNNGGK